MEDVKFAAIGLLVHAFGVCAAFSVCVTAIHIVVVFRAVCDILLCHSSGLRAANLYLAHALLYIICCTCI